MCLSRAVIRVLAYDYDLNLVERAMVKGVEDKLGWRVYGLTRIFCANKLGELDEVVLFKLGC